MVCFGDVISLCLAAKYSLFHRGNIWTKAKKQCARNLTTMGLSWHRSKLAVLSMGIILSLVTVLLRISMTKQLSGAMQKLACLVLDSVSRAASLGDLLLAPVCPIEKVPLWVSFLCLTSGSEIDEGVTKDKVLPELHGNWTGTPGSRPWMLSTRLSLHACYNSVTNMMPLSNHV